MRESARANSIMVLVKIATLLMFIVIGITAFDSDNFSPFYGGEKEGLSGVVTAASIIFFAYIGFDAISTSGEETKNPGRDLPIAILVSLGVATLLYILVAVVAVGALPSDHLAASEAPLAAALRDGAGVEWGASLIAFGALVSITSVVLTIMYGQTRIFFAMCRDGLAPRKLAKVHPRFQTPIVITIGFGVFIACIAAVVPLAEIVVLVNIGTLFAFLICNIAVVVLRRTRPDLERGFRVPLRALPAVPDHRRRALHLPDGRPTGDDLVALPVLARAGRRDLLLLRPPPFAPAAGRGRGGRGGDAGGSRVGAVRAAVTGDDSRVDVAMRRELVAGGRTAPERSARPPMSDGSGRSHGAQTDPGPSSMP